MIRHMILFKLRPLINAEELDHAINGIYDLKAKLKGILSIVAGECRFQDEKSDDFFSDAVSHSISIDFVDNSSLDRFFKDPVTHPAKEAIVNIAEGGYKGIIGFDLVNTFKIA